MIMYLLCTYIIENNYILMSLNKESIDFPVERERVRERERVGGRKIWRWRGRVIIFIFLLIEE